MELWLLLLFQWLMEAGPWASGLHPLGPLGPQAVYPQLITRRTPPNF